MSDYCTTAEVKAYIGTDKSTDDTLIATLIPRASKRIDTYTRRTFIKRTAETRKFDAVQDVDGRTLYVDDDLLSVSSITNGDGDSISASDYVLLPTNTNPKYAIRLKASSSESWTYSTDPEEAITVVGTWGYYNGTVPPDDIKHAAIRLTAWYYAQRKAPFETQGLPELGVVTVPTDIPPDIEATLAPYARVDVR